MGCGYGGGKNSANVFKVIFHLGFRHALKPNILRLAVCMPLHDFSQGKFSFILIFV